MAKKNGISGTAGTGTFTSLITPVLCSWCYLWDLKSIFDWPLAEYRPQATEASFGPTGLRRPLEDLVRNIGCPLCDIVYSGLSKQSDFSNSFLSARYTWLSYHVETNYSTPGGITTKRPDSVFYRYDRPDNDSFHQRLFRLVVSIEGTQTSCRIQRFAESDHDASKMILQGRSMTPEVDIILIQEWLKICDNRHNCMRDLGRSRPSPGSMDWMINVPQRKLVRWTPGLSSPHYAALSYVWGHENVPQLKHRAHGDNFMMLTTPQGLGDHCEDVPLTIRDSLRLCEYLNIEYLWVDAICLCQDDEAVKRRLASMSIIYGEAYVTIACVNGKDSWSGLPGIRGRAIDQTVRRVGSMYLGLAQAPRHKVEEGVWNTRGWTYQELVLSRRILYFTDDEVLFSCNDNFEWRESMHLERVMRVQSDSPGVHSTIDGKPSVKPLSHYASSSQGLEWHGRYMDHLENYGSRAITDPKDAIRAFEGVIKALDDVYRMTHFNGLPLKFLNTALLFRCIPPDPIDATDVFPTWSWAHWKSVEQCGYHGPKIVVHVVWYQAKIDEPDFRTTFNLTDEPVKFTAISQCAEMSAQDLLSTVPSEICLAISPDMFAHLDRMLVVQAEVLYISVCREAKDYTEQNLRFENGGPIGTMFPITDTRFLPPDSKFPAVCLDPAWRSEKGDELEFVRLSSQQNVLRFFLRLGRGDLASAHVNTLLIETDDVGLSRRVQLMHFNRFKWEAAGATSRTVYLC